MARDTACSRSPPCVTTLLWRRRTASPTASASACPTGSMRATIIGWCAAMSPMPFMSATASTTTRRSPRCASPALTCASPACRHHESPAPATASASNGASRTVVRSLPATGLTAFSSFRERRPDRLSGTSTSRVWRPLRATRQSRTSRFRSNAAAIIRSSSPPTPRVGSMTAIDGTTGRRR
ncbi:MAG: hypothetical protein AW07_04187 [Candidatus Accumulibacter sp. SK-11]|nr:MAG: hypothetical protein AW07_04187 [Candidatus Accumulibacter sp. SK-11]